MTTDKKDEPLGIFSADVAATFPACPEQDAFDDLGDKITAMVAETERLYPGVGRVVLCAVLDDMFCGGDALDELLNLGPRTADASPPTALDECRVIFAADPPQPQPPSRQGLQ